MCVAARAHEDPHKSASEEEKQEGLPTVAVDYCQIGENIEDETDSQTILVARDCRTRNIWATLVDCKGNGDKRVAKELLKFIDSLGYTKMIIRGDGEPALVEVMNKAKAMRVQDTLVRNPPAHDPQANGVAERAVQEFKGQLRAVKIALDRRLGRVLDPKCAALKWMVPHACDLINRYLVGADGRTAFYRLNHKNFHHDVVEFGERVHAKPLRKPKNSRKRALTSRTVDGIWLGVHPKTHEHKVVMLKGGPAIKVRTILRRPDSEKWSAEDIMEIIATPKVPNPKDTDQDEPQHIRETKGLDIGGTVDDAIETPGGIALLN